MFLILPKVANMGVTDVIVTVFYNVLNGLFLTDNNYYIVMAERRWKFVNLHIQKTHSYQSISAEG